MKKRLKLRMGTFFWHGQLSCLCDFDGLGRLVSRAFRHIFHLLHDVVAFQNFSKDYMLSIQPSRQYSVSMEPGLGIITADIRSNGCGYEELGTIGILSGVGHAEHTGLGVLQFEVFIWELIPIDGFSTSA